MGIGRVTEKSLKVMDLDKAVQLADRAFAEANVEAKPFVVSKYLTLDQSNSMQEIASLYMKLGRLSQATKAIEKISDRFVKDRDGKESPIPENDQFLRRYASGVTTKDEPFIEDGGREVFAYIEMLAEYPRGTSYPGLTRITSKFASLGHWDRAEKAFDMANEFYDEPFYVPSALVEEIAASNDVNRLRKWQKKCSPKSMGAFLEAYCRYCNNKRKLPSRDILIEFDLIRESMDSHQQCRDLDTMLLIGFWVDGMDEYVDKQFNRLGKKREVYLPAVARRAASFGFPKLAVKVAEKIKDKKSREETLLSFHRFKASGEFESEATPDENWLKKQPVAVKASLKMQQAKQILDAMEK